MLCGGSRDVPGEKFGYLYGGASLQLRLLDSRADQNGLARLGARDL